MLVLRPTCEHCRRPLPPASTDAMICSYECTFCRHCVADVLGNVCPNCGGGFVPRPVRPATEWRPGVSLAHQPASPEVVHKPVEAARQAALRARVGDTPPERR
ncbi:MAG: DUF1272 domain-containing protein [Pseudomonadales bacterium]